MDDYGRFLYNVEYLMKCKGIRNYDMAKRMGISPATFQNRKLRPELFTLREVNKLARILNVPAVKLFETQLN